MGRFGLLSPARWSATTPLHPPLPRADPMHGDAALRGVQVTEPDGQEGAGRDRGPARVGWLTVGLAASFAATFPLVASDHARHPVHVWGFLVITALFAAGELLLIHVPTRRDTH